MGQEMTMRARDSVLATAAVAGAAVLCGCSIMDGVGVETAPPLSKPKQGPPAHAPAHGRRRKQQHGADLRFESPLGVYVVVELPGVYFHGGLYMKCADGRWHVAPKPGGPWRPAKSGQIPRKLAKKVGKGAGKGKARGRKW